MMNLLPLKILAGGGYNQYNLHIGQTGELWIGSSFGRTSTVERRGTLRLQFGNIFAPIDLTIENIRIYQI